MRKRHTAAELATLRDQLVVAAEAERPVTVRGLFYRMLTPGLALTLPKSEASYRRVQRQVKYLREETTHLPFDWVVDPTRTTDYVATYDSPEQYVRRAWDGYAFDGWRHSDFTVELWCESRGVHGSISQTATDLWCPTVATGGFASLSLLHTKATGYCRDVRVLWVGDHDSSGYAAQNAALDRLRQWAPDDVTVTLVRIAVTPEQIEEMDLPTKPGNPRDKRKTMIANSVEVEAIPTATLRGIVDREIRRLMDPDDLAHAERMTAAGQHFLRTFDMSRYDDA